jgi:hypothetical protein
MTVTNVVAVVLIKSYLLMIKKYVLFILKVNIIKKLPVK